MIPVIRSFSELMAITESRASRKRGSKNDKLDTLIPDSGQRKRNVKLLKKNEVNLPDLPKVIRHKWINNKVAVSKFFDDLDYNNQIQSSYDLTLLDRQSKINQRDIA
tara:strand:- start:1013 stop:1333 length:321 start_codon:yes stop_codon:yes gene_type:complete